jgi:hypothetical protein
VFILLPLIALLIRRIADGNAASSYFLVSVLVFFLLQFSFLQKAAYAMLSPEPTRSFARGRCVRGKSLVFCAAVATGIIGAARPTGLAL